MIESDGQLLFDYGDMTIADKVLYLLRRNEWVTTNDFLQNGLYTFRNRISELRARGFEIRKESVPGKSIFRYKLTYDMDKMNGPGSPGIISRGHPGRFR